MGYSTNFQDLDIDLYKIELWKLVKEVLRLLGCDIQNLEDQLFPTIIEDEIEVTVCGNIYNSRENKKNYIDNKNRQVTNIQRNESLDKYRSLPQILLVLGCQVTVNEYLNINQSIELQALLSH